MVLYDVSWGNSIWDKLSEAANTSIFSNSKTPHNSSTHINFSDVNLSDLIKASSHQFYFGEINYDLSNVDTSRNNHSTDGSRNNYMILTNISKRDNLYPAYIRKVASIHNTYPTYKLKEITIYVRLYCQVKTSSICVLNHNLSNCQ